MSGTVGRLIGRLGNDRVMGISLLTVSTGSLLYAVAAPDRWGVIVIAAAVWIAWVGVNIGISNRLIDQEDATSRTERIALFFTATTLAFGLSALLGGWLFDRFRDVHVPLPFCAESMSWFSFIFIVSFLLRISGVLFLLSWKKTGRCLGEGFDETEEKPLR